MTKPLHHILRDELIRLEYGSTQLRDVSDASWAAAAELIADLVLVKERRGGPFVTPGPLIEYDPGEIRVLNSWEEAQEAFGWTGTEPLALRAKQLFHRLKCPGCGRLHRVDPMSVPCADCGKKPPENPEE